MNQIDKNRRDDQRWLVDQGLLIVDRKNQGANQLASVARRLLLGLAEKHHDDRYMDDLAPDAVAAAIVHDLDGRLEPIAFAQATQSRHRLQLDTLIVAPNHTGAVRQFGADDAAAAIRLLIDHLRPQLTNDDEEAKTTLELWTRPDIDHLSAGPIALGLTRHRSLHQLRVALSNNTEAVPTRPFEPDRDLNNLVSVNNRAFAYHPDQGGQTVDQISDVMSQPWFTNEGLRVLDDPQGSGAMAGFCWTKVHLAGRYQPVLATDPAVGNTKLGEIFVIGLDPDFHGLGLGAPLVASGMNWLHSQGLAEALLYVEADNAPALRTYERLRFVLNRVDTAWRQ